MKESSVTYGPYRCGRVASHDTWNVAESAAVDTRVSGSFFCVDLGLHVCPWEFLRIYVSNPYKSRAVIPVLSVVFCLALVPCSPLSVSRVPPLSCAR